jgi:hypothetical protein
MKTRHEKVQYLDKFTARKVQDDQIQLLANLPDSLDAWTTQYLHLAVIGVRSPAVTQKIALHLTRFFEYFQRAYGHDRISTCLKRDVVAWQKQMQSDGLHSPVSVPGYIPMPLGSLLRVIPPRVSENSAFHHWNRVLWARTRFVP